MSVKSKSSAYSLMSKLSLLKIPPQAWDAIFPHGPRMSEEMLDVLAAETARDVARLIEDKGLRAKVMSTSKEMAKLAARGMVQGWEDGDDICPPPRRWPWPGPFSVTEPDPNPWAVASTGQIVLADIILSLAEITASAEVSASLRESALQLVEISSSKLGRDFESTSVEPRRARS